MYRIVRTVKALNSNATCARHADIRRRSSPPRATLACITREVAMINKRKLCELPVRRGDKIRAVEACNFLRPRRLVYRNRGRYHERRAARGYPWNFQAGRRFYGTLHSAPSPLASLFSFAVNRPRRVPRRLTEASQFALSPRKSRAVKSGQPLRRTRREKFVRIDSHLKTIARTFCNPAPAICEIRGKIVDGLSA